MYRWATFKCFVIAGIAAWFGIAWLLWLMLIVGAFIALGQAVQVVK